ncbi:MAG: SPFH domain-containing protein [Candidatus Diapherotrites archaeon]|uniref:SPFH domain-containing protein n=1 Tax=Candidatus Iainarchaeum sp. TaxID=3101447 RepID=A0A8T4KWC4_9ARCH|nr:SPFH domain-containing protein [Candidatus Diapherotrites archaeon]
MMRFVYEFEEGVKFSAGKFAGLLAPGMHFFFPAVQKIVKVDMRTKTIDIPKQEVMTLDNVPVKINAVVYFKVIDAKKAVLNVQDYIYAVAQYAQAALRDSVGASNLDSVLAKREYISSKVKEVVGSEIEPWGIEVSAIKMQDIELPGEMKPIMAKQAEAEREKRASIIRSEGELAAAGNLKKAADILSKNSTAMHLRTLEALTESGVKGNKTIIPIPMELLSLLKNRK